MIADEICLTLPRDREFNSVAHLVIGGLAVRLNLTYEELEDLELALDGLLGRDEGDGDVTVALRLTGARIFASIGPFHGDTLRRELDPENPSDLSLRRVLETVVDSFELGEREGGHWVDLEKTIHPAPRESSA